MKYKIVPKPCIEFEGEGIDANDALVNFATHMDTDMNIYFDAVHAADEGKSPMNGSETTDLAASSDWMKEYWDNDGELYRDLDADPYYDAGKLPNTGRYEIIFDFGGVRRYCFVDAASMDEALGNFFRHHRNVTYDNIADHMEV